MGHEAAEYACDMTADAFTPPHEAWQPISPKYAKARRVGLTLAVIALAVPPVAVLALVPASASAVVNAALAVLAVLLVGYLWLLWLVGRQVRAYGFVERDDDLLVTRGVMFKRLVIVPYGRMQLVDLAAGPIDRLFGVTTVQLHTAAATTDATIPGLEPADAAALRDRLAAIGEKRSAGL